MFESIQQPSIVESVHRQIRKLILGRKLPPGSRLPTESVLMKELGVSRPALREAVRMLVGEGLLEVIHGKGTFVCEVNAASAIQGSVLQILIESNELSEILEARMILEPEIAARAAQNITESGLVELEEILQETEFRLRKGQSLFEITWDFHKKLADVAGNSALAQIIKILYEMIKTAQQPLYDLYFDPAQELDEHRGLLDTIRRGKPDQAREVMREHLTLVNQRTMQVLGKNLPGEPPNTASTA
jgi:GntR family transcriptional regulator, transcriptional repressor for pyruvate dehydrogenase complex